MSLPAAEWAIWAHAAQKLGWKHEPAYAGYTHPNHHPNGPANEWASYPSEMSAEEACFIDGVETLADACKLLESD